MVFSPLKLGLDTQLAMGMGHGGGHSPSPEADEEEYDYDYDYNMVKEYKNDYDPIKTMKNDKWWQFDKMWAIMRGGKYSDTWSNSEMALDRVTKSGGIQMDGNDALKWFQSKSKIFEFSNSESHWAEWQSHLPVKINIWGDQNDKKSGL